jgi:hypothetical protein
MRWPGFIEKFLYSCFGDRDQPIDPGPAPPNRRVVATQQTAAEPANEAPQAEQPGDTAVAESSGTTSERQQSEQSQSDTTQPTTQPTSIEPSTKVDSDPDEIAPTKAVPQITASVPHAESDPDAITPVTPPAPMYKNVKQALEDRRSLYERLRRKPESEIPPTDAQQASQQSNLGLSQANGRKAVIEEQSES